MSGAATTPRAARFDLLASLLLVGLVGWPLSQTGADDQLPPLRRVYVPADQLPVLGERYPELHSMPRGEFEGLVRRALRTGEPSMPQVESARYQAALDGDRLRGSAELVVRGERDARSMLRWPASAWTISGARWNSGDASIGYAGRAELGLLVPAGESHTLTFDWAISTEATEAGRQFEFRVPPSLWAEFALDLPRGLTPAAPGAAVSGPTDAPRPELQRWLMRSSPADAVRCLLLKSDGPRPFEPLVVYRRELEVDVAEDSAELLARLDLFVAHQPIRQIEFECSLGLKLFGWSGVKVHDWQERDGRVVLDLAEPFQDSAQLTVRAVAPGAADGKWTMPRLEIVGGRWTGGSTRLRAAPGLNLFDPQVTAGRVVSIQDTGSGRPELIIDHAAPDSVCSVRVSAEVPEVFAKIQTSIELGPRLAANVAANWQIASGEVTALELRIPPDWSFGDVNVRPEGLLSSWSLRNGGSAGRIATLRLNRPVSSETAISAHLRLLGPTIEGSSAAFAIPRVQPVRAHAAEETLSIEAKPAWSAELAETRDLSAASRPSTPDPSTGEKPSALSVRFDGPRAGGKIVVTRRLPELATQIAVNADVTEEATQVSYTLDLDLASGPPDWVDVRFHAATADSLTWDLPEGHRAERLDADSPRGAAVETWRVVLPRKAAPRVRLGATWRASHNERIEIPLPTVLQATATTGQVTATFPAELDLAADLTDLAAGPAPNGTAGRTVPAQGVRRQFWRYESGTPRLAIRVRPRSNLLNSESWIAHTRLRTTLDSDGGAIHTVQYDIHGKAGTEITLQLPSGATLRRARSNAARITAADGSVLRLICPPARDVWPIEVQYVTAAKPLGRWARLAFELPRISLPSLGFSWEMNAPADYAAVAWTRELIATPPHGTLAAPERLFGRLVRDPDAGPFKFWQAEAWTSGWLARTRPATDPVTDQLRRSLDEFIRDGLPRDRTWSTLIAHLDEFAARRLVIDTIALRDAGLDLGTRADLESESSSDGVLGLARTAELNLLRTARGLLLTSRKVAAELAASDDGTGLRKLDGLKGLAAAIDEAVLHGADTSGRFALASGWSRLAEPVGNRLARNGAELAMSGARWQFESLADPATVSITLLDNSLIAQAAATVVCFAILWAFVRKVRPGARWLGGWSLLVAAAFLLALTVPGALAAPAATVAWTLLIILIVWSCRPRRRSVDSPAASAAQLPSTITQAGAAGALLWLALLPRPISSAEPQEQTETPKYSLVFVPYDAAHPERRHEATRVLVPRETYDRLVEMAKLTGDGVEPALIRTSTYAGRAAADRLDLSIDFEIESFTPDAARVSLPLSGLLIRSAQLDGQPCLLEPGPHGLSLVVSGDAVHRLHIDAVLPLDSVTGEGTLDLTIPPTPTTKFDIELPPEITFDLEPPTASIEWIREPQRQRLRAELGAVNHLTARWRRGPLLPAELRADTASLLTWRQAASRFEFRANIAAESGHTRRLIFECDPRLVLERVRAAGMTGYWLRPGDRPRVVVEFERPLAKQTQIAFEFLVTESAGAIVAVPEVSVVDAKPGLKLVAVRTDGKASLQVVDAKEPVLGTVEDFQGLWGEPLPRSPEMVILQVPADSSAPRIERKQPDDRPVFRSQAELRVSATRVDLVSQLSCESAAGKSFRHELSLPAGFELTAVRASAGTQWRHVAPDRLIWFGSHGGDATPSIELQGWTPSAPDSSPLPVVRPLGDCQLLGELTVWRSRDVEVSLLDEHGMEPSTVNRELRSPSQSVVPHSQYDILAPDFAAKLKIERLTPRASATVASRIEVEKDGAEWTSVLDFQAEVGSFDKIEFRISDTIAAPIQIAGEGIFGRDVRRDGSDQVWTIQLEEPHWGSYRLALRGRVNSRPGGSLSVPAVHPAQVADSREYLLVLNATDETYAIRGAENQQSVPSAGFSKWFSEPVPKNALGAFELHEPVGGIELHRAQPVRSIAPQTALLERHRGWLRPGGTLLTESTLLIAMRSDEIASLALPESTSVLDMRVDGHAIVPSSNPDGQLQFPLAADDRPHEVRLWWSWDSRRSDAAEIPQIELPRLTHDDCPATWTVMVSPQWRIESSSVSATCRSLLEMTQAQAIAEQLERLVKSPSSIDAADRSAVLLDLEQRLVLAADVVRRSHDAEAEIGLSGPELRRDHDRAAVQLGRLMSQNRELLDRAGLAPLRARAEAELPRLSSARGATPLSSVEPATTSSAARPPTQPIGLIPQGRPVYFTTERGNVALTIEPSSSWNALFTEHLPAAVMGLCAWGLWLWLLRTDRPMLALAIGLGVIGALWCWKLRAEPVGPALLLAAVLVALGGLIRQRSRATGPAVAQRLST